MMGFKDAFSVFCDCWKLYNQYATSDLRDVELQQFAEAAGKLSRKYHEDAFAREIILAVINEIARIEKRKKRN